MPAPVETVEKHSWGTMTVRGTPPAVRNGGLAGIVKRRRGPADGESRYPGNKYYHGLARFPGDPQARTTSEKDWNEKRARRGMTKTFEDMADGAHD